MYLNPTRSAGHILSVVLRSPALHKTHTNGAHFGQLIHCLKAVVYRLAEKGSELLVVEDLETTAWWNLTNCGRVEAVMIITISALNKYAGITQTFSIHLTSHIIQVDTC